MTWITSGSISSCELPLMKHKLIILVMATACLVQAFDWSGYKLTEEKLPPVTIVNGNFEKGGEGWKLNDEHKVVRGEGINLSSGLVIERTDPNQYTLCGQHVKGCVPGQAYNISVRVRCENVQGGKKGATIGIEVKAGSSVGLGDFAHLKWFHDRFNPKGFVGVVLYTGEDVLGFGRNLYAVPMANLVM